MEGEFYAKIDTEGATVIALIFILKYSAVAHFATGRVAES